MVTVSGSKSRLGRPSVGPSSISVRAAARIPSSCSRTRIDAMPPSSIQVGRSAVSVVDVAVYGYWSRRTSTPSAWASATRARLRSVSPQLRLPSTLWWLICRGAPDRAATVNASSTAASNAGPSLRMCVA